MSSPVTEIRPARTISATRPPFRVLCQGHHHLTATFAASLAPALAAELEVAFGGLWGTPVTGAGSEEAEPES